MEGYQIPFLIKKLSCRGFLNGTPETKIYTVVKKGSCFGLYGTTHLGRYLGKGINWYPLQWETRDVGSFFELTLQAMKDNYDEVYISSYALFFPMIDEVIEATAV